MNEGQEKGLFQKIENKFVIGINFAFKFFNPTFTCFADPISFYKTYYNEIKDLPLIVGRTTPDIGVKPHPNTIFLKPSNIYNRTLSNGLYHPFLSGLVALSLAIYLLDVGKIYLLGFDGGKITNEKEEVDITRVKNKSVLINENKKYFRICYDKKTQVFTSEGWKYFKDLIGNELILTRKYNGKTEWVKIKAKQKYFYNGKMYKIKRNGIDLVITPNHNMCLIPVQWANRPIKIKKQYLFVPFKKILKNKTITNYYNIPKTFKWKGKYKKYFILPSCIYNKNITKKPIKILMKHWVRFLGLYISEGSKENNHTINISQIHTPYKDAYIKNILKSLPFNYSTNKTANWRVYSKQLYEYLKQFGKAKDKFIPKEIKELNKEYLQLLLDSLVFGDGYKYSHNTIKQYCTISPQLAKDVQEIAYKCGYNAEIYYRKSKIKNRENRWVVQFNYSLNRGNFGVIYLRNLKKYTKIIDYNDLVYDITIKNHSLWVKRNNVCIWSGNCSHWYQGKLEHRGIGKLGFYHSDNKVNKLFSVFKNETKCSIINVSPKSNLTIFPKISYDEMFNQLNNETHHQEELRQFIREKLSMLPKGVK